MNRCAWAEKTELERQYHDQEWENPVYDDQQLYKMLVL
ncbi:DNA-3-methyladenine glycosylase I [Enterococcus faecalis]